MKISKKEALAWFKFFASLPDEEEIMPRQQEIFYAVLEQIEDAVEHQNGLILSEIKGLKTFDGRTYYVGPDEKFPQGCRSCLSGSGLSAIRKTNRCNLSCPFCYNCGQLDKQPPIGDRLWEIGGCRYREDDIETLLRLQKHPSGVAYVYLEPFTEIEKYYDVIKTFHNAGIYQHLYTNGTLANEENLKALGAAGLDELRFNLGASRCAENVIKNIKTAKKYIPHVGIETPLTPEFYADFHEKKAQILATGLDFINCAELHLNENNIGNYPGENIYMSRMGYISPIYSRELTLKLMREAADEGWDIAVHDCSNRTKFIRGLNLKAKEGGWFGANDYGCEFESFPYEAFLPILEDTSFRFLQEEEMPPGYRLGEIVL